jgi:putative ATP-dependent endonuclease of OLD family
MAACFLYLKIENFRAIHSLEWRPNAGVNVILGGGNVRKSTLLEAIALLLSPTNSYTWQMLITGIEK